MSSKTIGIDLGTSYWSVGVSWLILLACVSSSYPHSCVGVWQNDRVEIIANDRGNKKTPSCVSFSDTGRLIGDAAKDQEALNPQNTWVTSVASL